MARIHLKNEEEPIEYDQVKILENGWVVGLEGGTNMPAGNIGAEATATYPEDEVEKVEVSKQMSEKSHLVEEEIGTTREARRDEPGDMVTEFEPVTRVVVEYIVE